MNTQPQSLSRHVEDISAIVAGLSLIGDYGSVDVLYDGDEFSNRRTAIAADISSLKAAGYRARKHGGAAIAIDLTNVGTAFNARFVK